MPESSKEQGTHDVFMVIRLKSSLRPLYIFLSPKTLQIHCLPIIRRNHLHTTTLHFNEEARKREWVYTRNPRVGLIWKNHNVLVFSLMEAES